MGDGEIYGRALLIGSPGENLRGVEHDVQCMAGMLRERQFLVDVRTGARATREGILTGYDELIAKVQPSEAAVFYYAGHGFHAFEKNESASWQGISPADLGASTTTDFRGITAWELSVKQVQLTQRTKNVTVILDCCYASQMSREGAVSDAVPGAVPRALSLPHPVRLGFAAHLAALREAYGAAFAAVDPIGNRDAVRLVACAQDESACEYPGDDGQYRGAFTTALLEVLREVGHVPVSWAAIESAIRARVLRRFPIQRPCIEGPAHRRLFSLEEDNADGAVAITETSDGFQLGIGRLMGAMPGDVYGVMPSGPPVYRAANAVAEVRVCETFVLSANARLESWKNGYSALPRNAIAILISRNAIRRTVRIDAPASVRDAVKAELDATQTLRLAEPEEESSLATLRLSEDALTIEDEIGPLFPAARFPEDLPATVRHLVNLGAAQQLRELEGEHGVLADEIEIEWGAVERGQLRRMPDGGGALSLNDKIYVKIKSQAQRPLYAHIFNVGLRGKVTLLTSFSPAGVELTQEQADLMLGQGSDGMIVGLSLGWPDGMPREVAPRIDELVVIVTSTAASLRGLETVEPFVAARAGDSAPASSTRAMESTHGFLVKRLWYFLHARDISK